MKNYERPIVVVNDELAEGVYAASGSAGGSTCYAASAYIHQRPELGRGDYRIQMNAQHTAGDGHHSGEQVFHVSFNKPVTYKGSNGTLKSGDGTTNLVVTFNYHNNGNDNIGAGDLIVEADTGLEVLGVVVDCNYDCGMH